MIFMGTPRLFSRAKKSEEKKDTIAEINKILSEDVNKYINKYYKKMKAELLKGGADPSQISQIIEEIKLETHAVLVMQLNKRVKQLKQENEVKHSRPLLIT